MRWLQTPLALVLILLAAALPAGAQVINTVVGNALNDNQGLWAVRGSNTVTIAVR